MLRLMFGNASKLAHSLLLYAILFFVVENISIALVSCQELRSKTCINVRTRIDDTLKVKLTPVSPIGGDAIVG